MNKTRLGLAHTPVLARTPHPVALRPVTSSVLESARRSVPQQLELPFARTGSAFTANRFAGAAANKFAGAAANKFRTG